jgi:hypothetical protein
MITIYLAIPPYRGDGTGDEQASHCDDCASHEYFFLRVLLQLQR